MSMKIHLTAIVSFNSFYRFYIDFQKKKHFNIQMMWHALSRLKCHAIFFLGKLKTNLPQILKISIGRLKNILRTVQNKHCSPSLLRKGHLNHVIIHEQCPRTGHSEFNEKRESWYSLHWDHHAFEANKVPGWGYKWT